MSFCDFCVAFATFASFPRFSVCYIGLMRPVPAFFFGYFWFSCAPGGREI